MSATAYITEDLDRIGRALDGWSQTSGVPVLHSADTDEVPRHTDDPASPAVFVNYSIRYQKVDPISFDPDVPPYRMGTVSVAIWVQRGASRWAVRPHKLALAQLLIGQSDETFVVDPPVSHPDAPDPDDLWRVALLDFPLVATA